VIVRQILQGEGAMSVQRLKPPKKMALSRRLLDDPEFAAERLGTILASLLAQELGFKQGSLWEPPIARAITADMREFPYERVERHWRAKLGLPAKRPVR